MTEAKKGTKVNITRGDATKKPVAKPEAVKPEAAKQAKKKKLPGFLTTKRLSNADRLSLIALFNKEFGSQMPTALTDPGSLKSMQLRLKARMDG